jgi:hypothetical protein
MTGDPALALALRIAARSEPGPLSFVFVTTSTSVIVKRSLVVEATFAAEARSV